MKSPAIVQVNVKMSRQMQECRLAESGHTTGGIASGLRLRQRHNVPMAPIRREYIGLREQMCQTVLVHLCEQGEIDWD